MIKKIIMTMFIITSYVYAEQLFINQNTDLYSSDKHIKSLGVVQLATKVTILEKGVNYSKIQINGWVLDENEDLIYKEFGVVNEVVLLNEINKKILHYKKKTEDEYGDIWNNIDINGWVKNDVLIKSMKDTWKKISTQYKNSCGVCHKVHSTKEFNANTWPSLVAAMGDRAGLTPNSKATIQKYLQEHAKK
jgi:trimethylamine-N-oxide reductase cytochrome c-type subunit TorC